MSRSEARSAAHNGRTGFPVRPFLFPAGESHRRFRQWQRLRSLRAGGLRSGQLHHPRHLRRRTRHQHHDPRRRQHRRRHPRLPHLREHRHHCPVCLRDHHLIAQGARRRSCAPCPLSILSDAFGPLALPPERVIRKTGEFREFHLQRPWVHPTTALIRSRVPLRGWVHAPQRSMKTFMTRSRRSSMKRYASAYRSSGKCFESRGSVTILPPVSSLTAST